MNKKLLMICVVLSLFTAVAALRSTQAQPSAPLEEKVVKIETSQQDLRERISSIQNLFYVAISLITFLGFTATILQYFGGKKERSMLQEETDRRFALLAAQSQKYEEFIKEQAARNKELLGTTQENIKQVTTLLSSLDQMLQFSNKADTLEKKLARMQEEREQKEQEEQNRTKETVKALNLEAMRICLGLNRGNYKTPENQQRIRSFRNKVTAIRVEARQEEFLNGNVFYILGLDFALRYLFDEAVSELEKAIRIAKRFATEDPGEIFYPDPNRNRGEIQSWNKKLVNICLFHKGIILYNLGKYKEAEDLFREAVLDYDDKDVKSMIYIPESKYLQGEEGFVDVINAFDITKKRVEAIADTRAWRESRDKILAQLYVRYGNCYYPSEHKKHYGNSSNLKLAEEMYKRAYELDEDFYIAKFSYAQALSEKAKRNIPERERREALNKARELFEEVLDAVKVKIGETSEAKILIMLYYTVIICCKEAQIEKDSINRYITKIYEEGGQLASLKGYRIFSPLSKSDLTYDELKKELEDLEREFAVAHM